MEKKRKIIILSILVVIVVLFILEILKVDISTGYSYRFSDDTHDIRFLILQDPHYEEEYRVFPKKVVPEGFIGTISTNRYINYFNAYCEEPDCYEELMERLERESFSRKTDPDMDWDTFHKIKDENLNALRQMKYDFESFHVFTIVIRSIMGGMISNTTNYIVYISLYPCRVQISRDYQIRN
ncbi:MAG: hypothetical protein Q8O30_06070 [Candidatus Omnitrophota bacterium]|nr:hypothetical protein [Candidatus Omnitrophota bacterium]